MPDYFGKRTCTTAGCGSACCYRQRSDFMIARGRKGYWRDENRELSDFIRAVEDTVKHRPEMFGQYADKVARIVRDKKHVMTIQGNFEQAKVVGFDESRIGGCYCTRLYYACIFLSDGEAEEDKACMVHPVRPPICRNTDMDFGDACKQKPEKK